MFMLDFKMIFFFLRFSGHFNFMVVISFMVFIAEQLVTFDSRLFPDRIAADGSFF